MSNSIFTRIRIILINTSHPGNIGSAARALKTMGLSKLYLVSPFNYPNTKATELAAGADDILANATVCVSLKDALHGCQLVIGSSSRARGIPIAQLDPRQCGEKIATEISTGDIAILFGNERSGLSNEELLYCHYHVTIPANTNYCSLNLAAAVQIICYEIFMANTSPATPTQKIYDYPASADEVENLLVHLQTALTQINFLHDANTTSLLPRLKRLFIRARLEKMEINILRGILTTIQKRIATD